MTGNFVAYRLFIDYSLIIGNNQLLNQLITHRLPIDSVLINLIDVIDYCYVWSSIYMNLHSDFLQLLKLLKSLPRVLIFAFS